MIANSAFAGKMQSFCIIWLTTLHADDMKQDALTFIDKNCDTKSCGTFYQQAIALSKAGIVDTHGIFPRVEKTCEESLVEIQHDDEIVMIVDLSFWLESFSNIAEELSEHASYILAYVFPAYKDNLDEDTFSGLTERLTHVWRGVAGDLLNLALGFQSGRMTAFQEKSLEAIARGLVVEDQQPDLSAFLLSAD